MSSCITKLVESYKAHPNETETGLRDALKQGAITPNDWDIGQLFCEAFGYGAYRDFRSQHGEGVDVFLKENAGAVTTRAFANINKQFVYATMLESYDLPEYEFTKLIPTVPSNNLKKLMIPGVTNIGDESGRVREGDKYPIAGVSENYIETPEVEKQGMIVPITKEAIFFDRTNLVKDRCSKVGEWLGYRKELRAIACVVDAGESETNGLYRYRWGKTSTGLQTIATYGDNSGAHTWDNLSASTPLVDYASIETAYVLMKAMTDPFTGAPLFFSPKHIVAGPSLAFKVPFATNGMVTKAVGGYATSGNPARTEIPNPTNSIIGNLSLVGAKSALLDTLNGATTTWYIGDLAKAFKCVQAWPLQVVSQGAGSESDYQQDIAMSFKASEMYTFATFEPRAVVKCTA